jgi:hypothetical protein
LLLTIIAGALCLVGCGKIKLAALPASAGAGAGGAAAQEQFAKAPGRGLPGERAGGLG